jgi:transglutaminase-like putative cysteine protease
MNRAPVRHWDTPSAAILVLALLVASVRLYTTNWTSGLEIPVFLTLVGVLLGLGLGTSRFRRPAVIWLSVGYSLAIILLISGWILYRDIPWLERVASIGGRLGNSLVLFFSRQPVEDPILFVFFTGIIFWSIGLVAGYFLTRHAGFAAAVLPAGIALIIIQIYDSSIGDKVVILGVYAFLSLALLGQTRFQRNQPLWKQQRVWVSAEARTNLNLTILVSALAVVILAWLAPANGTPVTTVRIFWQDLSQAWQSAQEDLGNAVAGLQGGDRGVQTTSFYSDRLELGLTAETDDSVYLRVQVPTRIQFDRYYWRVRTYSQYFNDEWRSVDSLDQSFTPRLNILPLDGAQGETGEFVFDSSRANLSLLVTPSRPIWVSRIALLEFLSAGDGKIDPLLFRPDPSVLVGEKYTVRSRIYNPTAAELRAAGEEYPDWVRLNYLQTPEDLPAEIRDLALEVTADADTPYERVMAITEYLRSTITYSSSIEAPPDGRDPLAWFLFDIQAGYCNYYASAEVLMLRSIGVPARMVVGFAQGEFDPPNHYVVRKKDAHAWPEVYFPGIGWVEFEPTGNQPDLVRAEERPEDSGDTSGLRPTLPASDFAGQEDPRGALSGEALDDGSAGGSGRIIVGMGIFLIVLMLLVIAYYAGLLDRGYRKLQAVLAVPLPIQACATLEKWSLPAPEWLRRWAYYAGLTPLGRSFWVVYRGLGWLKAPRQPGRTPAEAARELIDRLPESAPQVRLLLVEYQNSLYGHREGDLVKVRETARALLRRILLAGLSLHWQDFLQAAQRGFKPKRELRSARPASRPKA